MEKTECLAQWNAIIETINAANKGGYNIRTGFGGFCPQMQFVRVDFLNEKDWPHNIADNSIFVEFKVDMQVKTVEVFRCGHIWLSHNDQKKTNLAMVGMKKLHKAMGGKWFRLQTYKGENDLARKVIDFADKMLASVKEYTGGEYPYKQGEIDLY